jgi:SAM-dependent methyltransferase
VKSVEGRDHLGSGHSLAVARFRRRLLGGLDLEPGRGRWALDVGCGDGLEALELIGRGWKVRAVDLQPHPAWPALARQHRGSLRFELADDAALARWKGRFPLVFQKDVLHHVPDPAALLATLKRLTAPGGDLWLLECNRRNPVSYLHLTLLGGHQHFTRRRLEALARGAGLAPWQLWQREARVWPVESAGFQDLVDRLQDAMEAMPFWRPFSVYHLLHWRNPFRRGQGRQA